MLRRTFSVSLLILVTLIVGCRNTDTESQDAEGQGTMVTIPEVDLHTAVLTDNLEAIRQHIAAGSDLDVKEKGRESSPLIATAAFGKLEAARLLIDGGAKVNYTNLDGSTALHTAAVFGHLEVARLLVDSNVDLNITNLDGSTALLAAAFFGRIDIVRFLLERGADPNIPNQYGSTALSLVTMPFEEIIGAYDAMGAAFKSTNVMLTYDEIAAVRPKIAELLRSNGAK